LVADVFAEGIEATVPGTARETVDAVVALKEVSLGELAAKLSLDKSVTSRRLREATARGYLVNLETRRGRPARIVLGDPMPEMVKLLPEPGELDACRCCTVAVLRRGHGSSPSHYRCLRCCSIPSGGGVVSFIPVSTEDFGKRADIGHPRPRVQRRKGQVERRR